MPARVQHSHHILSSTLMASSTNFFFRLCLFISLALAETHAATFDITNNCNFTVWAAAIPGGGIRLDQGETWSINVRSGTTGGRIWGRTNCNFDEKGRGHCQTGDCDGLLDCKAYGTPPNTIAEYALKQFSDLDFFDISLVYGFNVAMEFTPTTGNCRGLECTADINQQCPTVLKAPGGCNNPCSVFNTSEYCCTSGNCNPTTYSKFFKQRCPDAYSYPKDDQTSTFTCPSGTDYRVAFCPCSCSWFDEMADYVAGDGTSYKVNVFQSE